MMYYFWIMLFIIFLLAAYIVTALLSDFLMSLNDEIYKQMDNKLRKD